MQQDHQFHVSFERKSFIKSQILPIFFSFASYPRLLLEVFLRKNFGRRYFSLSTCLMIAIVMFFYPFLKAYLYLNFPHTFSTMDSDFTTGHELAINQQQDYLASYEALLLFVIVFCGFAISHKIDLVIKPSGFNFSEHSMYCGDILPIFLKVRFLGKPVSLFVITIFLEPLFFFMAGYILHQYEQKLGLILMICSVWYSLSYIAAFAAGTRLAQDLSDKYVANKALSDVIDMLKALPEHGEYSQIKPAKETLNTMFIGSNNSNQNGQNNDDITLAV